MNQREKWCFFQALWKSPEQVINDADIPDLTQKLAPPPIRINLRGDLRSKNGKHLKGPRRSKSRAVGWGVCSKCRFVRIVTLVHDKLWCRTCLQKLRGED